MARRISHHLLEGNWENLENHKDGLSHGRKLVATKFRSSSDDSFCEVQWEDISMPWWRWCHFLGLSFVCGTDCSTVMTFCFIDWRVSSGLWHWELHTMSSPRRSQFNILLCKNFNSHKSDVMCPCAFRFLNFGNINITGWRQGWN
jgi:hypothetical protein